MGRGRVYFYRFGNLNGGISSSCKFRFLGKFLG